ncbi:MAG TPA: 50S ribosomal protein L31 [Candidatus Paceibacterota bacterium]
MKSDIHPTYYPEAKVTCACGNKFSIGSTQETIKVEICSNCHPLYTGKEKIMDMAGRVEKFKTRRVEAGKRQEKITADKKAKAERLKKKKEAKDAK